MPFEWSEIKNKWLDELPISIAQHEIVLAFNNVEKRFGSSFFNDYEWLRGIYFITLIIDLNKVLEEVEKGTCKLPENGEVIKRIKENKIQLASTIIRLAAFYLRHNLSVEFEPKICEKKPDLRVNFKKTWIYIEETKLNVSIRFKERVKLLKNISDIIGGINSDIYVNVFLLKENLNFDEIKEIKNKIKILSSKPSQPQECKIKDLSKIVIYKKVKEKRPALYMDTLNIGSVFERHSHVGIQFIDVRLDRIHKKLKQLSREEHNMLILDISVPNNMREWSESIQKTLLSGNHSKIGAILLIEEQVFMKSLKLKSNIILHPYPLKPLDIEFIKLTESYFDEFSEFKYSN